ATQAAYRSRTLQDRASCRKERMIPLPSRPSACYGAEGVPARRRRACPARGAAMTSEASEPKEPTEQPEPAEPTPLRAAKEPKQPKEAATGRLGDDTDSGAAAA